MYIWTIKKVACFWYLCKWYKIFAGYRCLDKAIEKYRFETMEDAERFAEELGVEVLW